MSKARSKMRNEPQSKKLTEFFVARSRASSNVGSSPAPALSSSAKLKDARTPVVGSALRIAKTPMANADQAKPTHITKLIMAEQPRQTRSRGTAAASEAPTVDPTSSPPLRRSPRKMATALPTPSTSSSTERKPEAKRPLMKRKATTPAPSPSKPARAPARRTLAAVDSGPGRTLRSNPSPIKAPVPVPPSPRKRRKLSPTPQESVVSERIPSSLSDEEELLLPTPKKLNGVTRDIETWRRRQPSLSFLATSPTDLFGPPQLDTADAASETCTLPPLTDDGENDPMEVVAGATRTSVARDLGLSRSSTRSSMLSDLTDDEDTRMQPPSTPPPMPVLSQPTPQPLDTASKTAKLIAEIRAKAAAAVADDSDEEPKDTIPALSDSEDEDLFPTKLAFISKGKEKANSPRSPNQTVTASSPVKNARYSLRTRAKTSPGGDAQSSAHPEPKSSVAHLTRDVKPKRATKESDPIEFLLRDKRAKDRRGQGASALAEAEETVARFASLGPDLDNADWEDEEAARRIALESTRLGLSSSPPALVQTRSARSLDIDDEAEEDAERLLGSEQGKAVGLILQKDRAAARNKGKAVDTEATLGVQLWRSPSVFRDPRVGTREVEMPLIVMVEGAHPILRMLGGAVEATDTRKVVVLLNTLSATKLSAKDLQYLASWLSCLVVSEAEPEVIEAALRILPYVLANKQIAPVSLLPALGEMLYRLGATTKALSVINYDEMVDKDAHLVTLATRADAIYSSLELVKQCAHAGKLPAEELASLTVFFITIAMDLECPPARKRDVMAALEFTGRCIPRATSEGRPSSIEEAVAQRVLDYATCLKPANQAHLLSLFAGGCPQMANIARWTAHALLLGDEAPKYGPLPPISSLWDLVAGSKHKLRIDDSTDYETLYCNIDILAAALTNVDAYVAEERRLARMEKSAQPSGLASPSKLSREKSPTPLEGIKMGLDSLHNRIVDTHAAHLERSRAKSAIQRLSMRIHYQWLGASRGTSDVPGKPRKIGEFYASTPGTPRSAAFT